MKYFQSLSTQQVYAYDSSDQSQIALIAEAGANPDFKDITAAWPLAPTAAQMAAQVAAKLAEVRTVREAMLNRMTGIALVAQVTGDTATVTGFQTARQGLLDITTGCPTDPAQVDAFIQGKYASILAALPASLVKAFAGVDA